MQNKATVITECRGCKGRRFKKWFDLGRQPLANALLKSPQYPEEFYPLTYMYCLNCELVQTMHVIAPDILFGDYVYHSSTSQIFVNHFKALAEREFNADRLIKEDLVIDIGSNDGILLKPFKSFGARVLGVEPAKGLANEAAHSGIETLPEYFTPKLAGHIRENFGEAQLITATNVFAHIDNLDEVMAGVKFLLAPNGRFMVEVAYLPDMLNYGTFDLLYHEHLCAWHLYPLEQFFLRHGMVIDEVEFIPVHGGSIRVFAKMEGLQENRKSIGKKMDKWITGSRVFKAFPARVEKNKKAVMELLQKLKKENKAIIGYGAPAKMSTITNYFGIGPEIIDIIIDDSPAKQFMYSPGKHIKIVPFPQVVSSKDYYMVIFAWNFAESIMELAKAKGYRGKFIIPFPTVKVL